MIDEELYQQATDELNSDRRRSHLWARACALASDDHDEARYLYTNLRVEELLAERDGGQSAAAAPAATDAFAELSLEPIAPDAAPDEPAVASSRAGTDAAAPGGRQDDAFGAPVDSGTLRPSSVRTERRLDLDSVDDFDLDTDEIEAMNERDGQAEAEATSDEPFEPVLLGGKPDSHRAGDEPDDWLGDEVSLGDAAPVRFEPNDVPDHGDGTAGGFDLAADPGADPAASEPPAAAADASERPAGRPDAGLAAAAALAARRAGASGQDPAGDRRPLDAMHDHQAPADRLAPANAAATDIDWNDDASLDDIDDDAEPIVSLEGRGAIWAVYETTDGRFKALRRGVSVGALLFTLPWLMLRGLIGTALMYALLWAAVVAGLVITALAWSDAGAAAPMLLKLVCTGFAVIAALGLIVLPFLSANRWRENAWQRRGYALRGELRARSGRDALQRFQDALRVDYNGSARA